MESNASFFLTWRDPDDRFLCRGERIGSGATKCVYRAFDRHEGREVAWCRAALSGMEQGEHGGIVKEVALMRTLDHPRIVRLVASWTDARSEEMVFVTDLYGGSVDAYLRKHGKQCLSVVRKWARQLCEGLVPGVATGRLGFNWIKFGIQQIFPRNQPQNLNPSIRLSSSLRKKQISPSRCENIYMGHGDKSVILLNNCVIIRKVVCDQGMGYQEHINILETILCCK